MDGLGEEYESVWEEGVRKGGRCGGAKRLKGLVPNSNFVHLTSW